MNKTKDSSKSMVKKSELSLFGMCFKVYVDGKKKEKKSNFWCYGGKSSCENRPLIAGSTCAAALPLLAPYTRIFSFSPTMEL